MTIKVHVSCSSFGDPGGIEAMDAVEKAVEKIHAGFSKLDADDIKNITDGLKALGNIDDFPYRTLDIGGTVIIDLSKKTQ
jgi:hypothetical protein